MSSITFATVPDKVQDLTLAYKTSIESERTRWKYTASWNVCEIIYM